MYADWNHTLAPDANLWLNSQPNHFRMVLAPPVYGIRADSSLKSIFTFTTIAWKIAGVRGVRDPYGTAWTSDT